jgi:ABC-type molybdate transport system permease subunit
MSVAAMALLLLFGKRGVFGGWLEHWFGVVFAFRWTGAALASAIMGFPLMVRAIRLSIAAIDRRYETVARTLGGSRSWVFLSVTLPLALPGIIAGAILCFILAMNAYATPVLLGGPQFKMMGPLVFGQFRLNNWPFGASVAFVLMTATLALTGAANLLIHQRYGRERRGRPS